MFTVRKRGCGMVMFLHLSVILFTGGVSAPMHAGIHTPSRSDTPFGRHPPPNGHCCRWYTSYWNAFLFYKCLSVWPRGRGLHPGLVCIQGGWADHHPPIGYYGIRSTRGQYTSYWNAFLFFVFLLVWNVTHCLDVTVLRLVYTYHHKSPNDEVSLIVKSFYCNDRFSVVFSCRRYSRCWWFSTTTSSSWLRSWGSRRPASSPPRTPACCTYGTNTRRFLDQSGYVLYYAY